MLGIMARRGCCFLGREGGSPNKMESGKVVVTSQPPPYSMDILAPPQWNGPPVRKSSSSMSLILILSRPTFNRANFSAIIQSFSRQMADLAFTELILKVSFSFFASR